ncbi:hypothetical protein [Paracoccus sp. NSM]|uniref:hypothetical protein n=1 Tax=Paracoccus sp. NSM TaxID=3457784 RepID=UPI004037176F
MSRQRIGAKIRKNPDYIALARYLDAHDLKHEIVPPTGKGHPALRITLPDGSDMIHHIACTPRGRCHVAPRVAQLRRRLEAKGVHA